MHLKKSSAVLAFAVVLMWAAPASAAAGDLDKSFDGDGAAVTDFWSGTDDSAEAVVVQPDGKIVAAGKRGGESIRDNFALARYNPDGSLDEDFGTAGRVITDFDGDDDEAKALALQPDGKIIAAGSATLGDSSPKPALVRYNPDGSRDTTFSGDGRVVTTKLSTYTVAEGIAIQPDGKIVLSAVRWDCCKDGLKDFVIIRYLPNGTLDTTFGEWGTGIIHTGFGGDESAYDVALQADGKIVAVGFKDGLDFAIVRYSPDGTLDRNFDDDGKTSTGFGADEIARAVAIQRDGKIVVVGQKNNDNFAIARYTTKGALDTTFDKDGKKQVDFGGGERAHDVAIQADGKIVVVGYSWSGSIQGDMAVARLNTNGTRDSRFSGDGMLTQGISARDMGNGVAIAPDGKIVVAGTSGLGGSPSSQGSNFAVLRFQAS